MGSNKIINKSEEVKQDVVNTQVVEEKPTYKRVEKTRGKKYVDMRKRYDHAKLFTLPEAIKLVKEISYTNFKGTIEAHLVLKKGGIATQVTLPYQAGKVKKVEIADEKTIEKLKAGTVDFDILVSTAEMMPKLVQFARLLGPKGLMPNPKNGTLVSDLKKAEKFSTATITLKSEKEAPLVHTTIGKVDQDDRELIANLEAILSALGGSKQILRVFIKSTMSPSVKVQI